MGAPESNTTNIYGIHLRESANDGSDFSNAAADYRVLFLGESGGLYTKDSAGAVVQVGLSVGSSFPSNPNDNDLALRTDLDCQFYRYESTGTMWLCTSLHYLPFVTRTAIGSGIAATTTSLMNGVTLGSTGSMYAVDFIGQLFATATNDADDYWTIELQKLTGANAATQIAQLSTQSNTAANWVQEIAAIDAIVDGSTHLAFRVDVTEVGTANSVIVNIALSWKHVFDV